MWQSIWFSKQLFHQSLLSITERIRELVCGLFVDQSLQVLLNASGNLFVEYLLTFYVKDSITMDYVECEYINSILSCHHHHHHHSFNVSVPLTMGCAAPMFVLGFFLHSILFAGSALDSFHCLRSLLIVSFPCLLRSSTSTLSINFKFCDAVNTTIIPYNMPKPT